jgi:excisionase family DNA binding protein
MNKEERAYMETLLAEVRTLKEDVQELRGIVERVTMSKEVMTMSEACEYLKVGRSTMQEWLKTAVVDFAYKQGKRWVFPVTRVREFSTRMG